MLPTSQCSDGAELAPLNSSVVAYSVLQVHNVLNSKFAFAPVAEILHQVTDSVQRATSTLSTHLQTDFRQAAQVLNSRFSRALVHRTPHNPPPPHDANPSAPAEAHYLGVAGPDDFRHLNGWH